MYLSLSAAFSQIADLALALSFLNPPIQFYLNNVTNLHQFARYDITPYSMMIVS